MDMSPIRAEDYQAARPSDCLPRCARELSTSLAGPIFIGGGLDPVRQVILARLHDDLTGTRDDLACGFVGQSGAFTRMADRPAEHDLPMPRSISPLWETICRPRADDDARQFAGLLQ